MLKSQTCHVKGSTRTASRETREQVVEETRRREDKRIKRQGDKKMREFEREELENEGTKERG